MSGSSAGVFVAAYVLITTRKINRVGVAVAGRSNHVGARCHHVEHAFLAEDAGIARKVVCLLPGMMLIVGVLKCTSLLPLTTFWRTAR